MAFTEESVRALQELISWWRRQRVNTLNRPHVEDEQGGSPEVYVARVPTDGIPACSHPGTGTAPPAAEDGEVPGTADCLIYYIDELGTLQPIGELKQTVHNLSFVDVPGDTWCSVHRDKFGRWLAATVGSSGSSLTSASFEVISDVSVSIVIDMATCLATATVTKTFSTVTLTGDNISVVFS